MAQDPSTAKSTAAAADYDALVSRLDLLREDLSKLAGSLGAAAGRQGHSMARDLSDGMTEAVSYASRKGHSAEARIESAVAANPLMALGLAAGVGLLLGALTRR